MVDPVPARHSRRTRLTLNATTSGMLLGAAAAPILLLDPSHRSSLFSTPSIPSALAALAAVLLLVAGVAIPRLATLGKTCATVGILCSSVIAGPRFGPDPLAALLALVLVTTTLVLLWRIGAPLIQVVRIQRRPLDDGQTQGAAIAGWVVPMTLTPADPTAIDLCILGWAAALAVLLAAEWAIRLRQTPRAKVVGGVVGAGGVIASPLLLAEDGRLALTVFAVVAAIISAVVRRPSTRVFGVRSLGETFLGHPERFFVGTFAILCVGGTALLSLPQCAAPGVQIGTVDALFTATSAVCVTGLAVLDTANDFSPLGQGLILLMIQIGGLGIMTFSTVALWALGRRLSLKHEGVVASLISTEDRGTLHVTARRILWFTVLSEILGAGALALHFGLGGEAWGSAIGRGVFTSISAFCNAGFALQSDSLISYQRSPFVLHVVGALIVVGGLSPVAVLAVPRLIRRTTAPISAQIRLCLAMTALLLVGGTAFFLAFEWNGTLAGLSFVDRLHNAWFQSVTLRTAGFNSIDLSTIRPETTLLVLVWMFIGGSPGGTAGGVKTTTVGVLLLSVVRVFRGQWTLHVFGRRIPERTRVKAIVTVTLAVCSAVLASIAILLTQELDAWEAVFEVVSALGTVGLSIGGTAHLDGIGKAIIVLCMFTGRVGGLTLLMFLADRRAPVEVGRPEEDIDVG